VHGALLRVVNGTGTGSRIATSKRSGQRFILVRIALGASATEVAHEAQRL